MIMKKWLALILALAMSLALCACGGGDTEEPAADEDTAATEVETETTEEEPAAEEDNFSNNGIKVTPFEPPVEGCYIKALKNSDEMVDILLNYDDGTGAALATVRSFADQAAVDSSKRPYEDPAKCSVSEVTYAGITMTEYTYLAPAFGWDMNSIFYWEVDGAYLMMQLSYDDPMDRATVDTFITAMVENTEAVSE